MNKGKCLFMRLVFIIGLIVQCALLQASTLIDGLYYDLDTSNHTATVTYETTGINNYASLPADVVIPESVTYGGITYTVVKIGNEAFVNCKMLESISVPSTVVQIGKEDSSMAFSGCTSLKRIRFEDGTQKLVLGAYYDTDYKSNYGRGLFLSCPLEEVYIGRNISYKNKYYAFEKYPQYYGYSAFYNQPKLAKVTISSTVTEIPICLFKGCSVLSNVSILGRLTKIPAYSFDGCNLSTLNLSNSIEEIGDYAFQNNTALTTVSLGGNIKTIGGFAFYKTSVTSINIPNNVTIIGESCFAENTKLEKVTIGTGCKELPTNIFSGCSALASVVLNDGLETISDAAFANCKSLESISIPGTVGAVGTTQTSGSDKLPFYNCTSLKNVKFEDGTQPLTLGVCYRDGYDELQGCGLFYSCPLEEVYIGRNISYKNVGYAFGYQRDFNEGPIRYGYSAFYNQPNLTKVTISSTVTEIPAYLFYKNASLTLTSLPKVKKIGASAFQDCSKLTTLNLGQDLQVVGNDAFNGCSNVTKLTFPDATTTIGARAFQNCSSVTEVTVGKELKTIGASAFLNCKSFTALLLPDEFTTMGESAFEDCIKLTVAKLGKSLTAVPARAFKNCIALSEMRVPATAKSIGDEAFYNDYTLAVVSMKEGLETIGERVFYNNRGILEFSIPGTVTSIGQNSFYGCTNTSVMSFEDGDGVLTIDTKNTRSAKIDALTNNGSYQDRKNDYFYDCPIELLYLGRNLKYDFSDNSYIYDLVNGNWKQESRASAPFVNSTTLEEVQIGPKVSFVYNHLCDNCDKLTSVSFPVGIHTIGGYAFKGCDKLASITFEESSDHSLSIETAAFKGCVALEDITYPGQLSVLGNSAYQGCENLKSVIFNKNEQYQPALTIGAYTFANCPLITELSFPGRLTSIGSFTFASCISLSNVSFEDSNTAVKLGYGASSLENSLKYDEKLPLFGNSNLTSLYIGRNIGYITEEAKGYSPFYSQQFLTDVRFSQAGTVTYCKDYLLYKVNNCESLTLPESLTSIGNWTFRGMSKLGSIVIPNTVTTIGEYAFADDSALESAKLSTSCAWLQQGLFSECGKLLSITIPMVVTKMDTQMFTNCKSLTAVTFEDGTDLIEMGYGASNKEYGLFRDCPIESLYLGRWLSYSTKDNSGNDAPNRAPFCHIPTLKNLTIGKNVGVIDKFMFSYCTGLEDVFLPDNITSIGMWGFRGCTSLKSVRLSQNLSQIADYGFSECSSLDNVVFPASMTSVADNSFSNCTSLRKLDLGSSLKIIGPSAFQNCTALEGIDMPKTLEGLGVESFAGCTSLPYVEVKGEVPSVGKQAFQGCTGLTWISLSENISSLGENSFEGCTNIKYVKSYATSPVPTGLVNFPEEVVANGTLFVPVNVINNYKRSATWRKWGSIKAMTEDVFLSSLTLNQSDAHLKASETLALAATVGPDEATNKKVDWKSDDETVASVSADGVVTAHKVGQTSIHAIANDGGGAKATCTITVDPTMVSSITLSQENLSIRKNHTAQLSAIVAPTDATNASFIWSSTNEDVAKVSEDGVISAIAPGDAVIKATSQDGSQVEASCQVKVLPVLKGDSNDDDEINVVDAVNTVNYIFNKVTGTFVFEAADVNSDDHISISDVTGTTDLIMQQVLQVKEQGAMAKDYGVSAMDDASSSDRSLDCLVLSQQDKSNIDIALDNNSNFAALQADITLPVNVNDVEVKLSGVMATTHQLSYSKLNAHTLRVVVYSLSNSTFMDGQPIFCLSSKKNLDAKSIGVTNAIGSDVEAKGYRLTSRNNEVTSIDGIGVDGTSVKVVVDGLMFTGLKGTPIYIYTTSGILVKTFSLASETSKIALQAGVYLVKMNGQVVKITVK